MAFEILATLKSDFQFWRSFFFAVLRIFTSKSNDQKCQQETPSSFFDGLLQPNNLPHCTPHPTHPLPLSPKTPFPPPHISSSPLRNSLSPSTHPPASSEKRPKR